jgi:hypothetical protein
MRVAQVGHLKFGMRMTERGTKVEFGMLKADVSSNLGIDRRVPERSA